MNKSLIALLLLFLCGCNHDSRMLALFAEFSLGNAMPSSLNLSLDYREPVGLPPEEREGAGGAVRANF